MISAVLVMAMLAAFAPTKVEAAKAPKLSTKSVTVTAGKKKTVKLKNVSKVSGLKWTSKSKKIATVKKSGKLGVVIKGIKKGTTKVYAKFKYKGKKYVLSTTVKVTAKKTKTTATPTPTATSTVTPTPTLPTTTPTVGPTATPLPPTLTDDKSLADYVSPSAISYTDDERNWIQTTSNPIIYLQNNDTSCSESSVTVATGSSVTVTITKSGTYTITGTGDNTQILVDAKGSDVRLILSDATINKADDSAIYFKKATSGSIVLKGDNYVGDGNAAACTTEPKNGEATILTKSSIPLVISGKDDSSLIMNSTRYKSIMSKDVLKIFDANITVEDSSYNAISGSTGLLCVDSKLTINTTGDGLKSGKGSIFVENSTLDITATDDGIEAEGYAENSVRGDVVFSGKATINAGIKDEVTTDTQCGIHAANSITIESLSGDLDIKAVKTGLYAEDCLYLQNTNNSANGTLKLSRLEGSLAASNYASMAMYAGSGIRIEGIDVITDCKKGIETYNLTFNNGSNTVTMNNLTAEGIVTNAIKATQTSLAVINFFAGNLTINTQGGAMNLAGSFNMMAGKVTMNSTTKSYITATGSVLKYGGEIVEA